MLTRPFERALAAVGNSAIGFLEQLSSLVWFVRDITAEMRDRLKEGRTAFRLDLLFEQTDRIGVGAVPLLGTVSMFLGATTALLTGYQLERFGTERLVPGLVAISFTRELGPLLTGIILAARSGAAFTAELGTMKVSEEIDAMEGMGIGPLRYLAAPRILASFLLLPCLAVVSSLAALIGASVITFLEMQISYGQFYDLVLSYLVARDIWTGLIKAALFGFIIGLIACYKGLTAEGGASAVGASTTSSVVTTIGSVIGCDMICNMIFLRLIR